MRECVGGDCHLDATVEISWVCVHEHIETYVYCAPHADHMQLIASGDHPNWRRCCCVTCANSTEEPHMCTSYVMKVSELV